MELAEESREITTFVTHRGLYRYRRLIFGIASAPENYQKIVKVVLRDCKGAANIADDMIVHGRRRELVCRAESSQGVWLDTERQ